MVHTLRILTGNYRCGEQGRHASVHINPDRQFGNPDAANSRSGIVQGRENFGGASWEMYQQSF
jgi:hypothetical protein